MKNFARSVIVVLKKGVCLRKFRPHNILILRKLLSNDPATNAYSKEYNCVGGTVLKAITNENQMWAEWKYNIMNIFVTYGLSQWFPCNRTA